MSFRGQRTVATSAEAMAVSVCRDARRLIGADGQRTLLYEGRTSYGACTRWIQSCSAYPGSSQRGYSEVVTGPLRCRSRS
jgi:hypothetical protein